MPEDTKNLDNKPETRLRTNELNVVEFFCNPQSATHNNWNESYKKAGYSQCQGWQRNAANVRSKSKIADAIKKKTAEFMQNITVTREYLISKLQTIVEKPDKQSDLVSASREIADLCGFHRELSINPEKEAKKRVISEEEAEMYDEFVRQRTAEAAKTIKIHKEAG